MIIEEQARQERKIAAQTQAATAELERQTKAAEIIAAAAERERVRRFAPDGVVFNVQLISVSSADGLASIPPGTELKVTQKNPDGSLRVQWGELFAEVLPNLVTNDRDFATALRSDDVTRQAAIRDWKARQAASAAEQEQEKLRTRATYEPVSPVQKYVSPLERIQN